MSIRSFLKLAEIQTKVASMIPFLLGNAYAIYHFKRFNILNFMIMLISLLTFDMLTTTINNYIDYKKARKTYGYNYETHNAIIRDNIKESAVWITIMILLLIASTTGFILFLRTNIIILILGILSFITGILYSFGPIPISRMPLGEIFSGLFMGFMIVFISIYIHIYDIGIVDIVYQNEILTLNLNLKEIIYIFLISLPAVIGIANIMLANNICDMEDDIINKRYTLPIYIGKDRSLRIFKILYYIIYIDIILLVILYISPIFTLATLFTFIIVKKNIRIFFEKQSKKDTFVTAVRNFTLINLIHVLMIGIGILL
ncbi:MAG: 1,4-dihydroxy-2-naphthoate polyprenyltransferase [Epulopiscium sp.]|nr:1,4-dihydroxy-2-naphthoate polyprenyltransferase [Candidatus Epulonipiscium sp.]